MQPEHSAPIEWEPVRSRTPRPHVVYWNAYLGDLRAAVRNGRYEDNGLFRATLYLSDRAEDRIPVGDFPTRQRAQTAAAAALRAAAQERSA